MKKKSHTNGGENPGSPGTSAGVCRALFEGSPDAIYIHNPEGRILETNAAAARAMGRPVAKLRKMRVQDIYPRHYTSLFKRRMKELLRNGSSVFESEHRRRSGGAYPVEVRLRPVTFDGKRAVIAVVRDITKEKSGDSARRGSESDLKKMIDFSPMAIAISALDGKIEYLNRKSIETFGYLPKDIPDMKRWWALACPDKKHRREAVRTWTERVRRALRKKSEIAGGEYRVTCKNGSVKTAYIFGAIVAGKMLIMFEDISASKKAEATLRRSEADYRTLIETTHTGYVILDGRGRVLDANREYVRLTGHRGLEEIYGRPVTDWTASYERKKNAAAVQKCLHDGRIHNFEVDYQDLRGRVTPVEVNATVLDNKGAPLILTICRDISERRRATEEIRKLNIELEERVRRRTAELQESEANYRLLFEGANDAMFIHDLKGRFIEANRVAVKRLGYTTEEFRGMTLRQMDTPEAAERIPMRIAEIKRNGRAIFESANLRKDGTVIPVEVNARLIDYRGGKAILAILRDITERKRTEAALKESEKLYRQLFESISDAVFIHDSEARILNVNEAACREYGYTRAEFLSMTVAELDTPEQAPNIPERISALMQNGAVTFETRHRRKDGGVIDLEVRARRIDWSGRPAMMSLCRDITTRKRAEETIKDLNVDLNRTVGNLREANRELEAFTYSVSHDLRTPLRHMTTFARLLTTEADDALKGETKHYLEVVSNSAKKMDLLITSLLAFSKLARKTPEVREFSGRELAEEAMADIKQDFPGREIEWEIGEIPPLKGDRVMLKQVFVNLLHNAVKYSRDRKPARVKIFAAREGRETVIGVRDTGVGFDVKRYDQLFGVFQRLHTESEFEGTGIGLANVKSVVLKHGGRVWAESVPDKETTFYFSLPAGGAGGGRKQAVSQERTEAKNEKTAGYQRGNRGIRENGEEDKLLRLDEHGAARKDPEQDTPLPVR